MIKSPSRRHFSRSLTLRSLTLRSLTLRGGISRHHVRALTGAVLGLWLWYGGARGNDTGGIIPWSPGIDAGARQIAAGHCGVYGKYAVITSVHPWYGDYIGFACRRPGRWGPALQ